MFQFVIYEMMHGIIDDIKAKRDEEIKYRSENRKYGKSYSFY